MGRASVKQNKNRYQQLREGLGLSREKASELLEGLSPERIEKIESEKSMPHPDEVLLMAKKYKDPALCNYYCSRECPIGEKYVPEIEPKELPAIVLETLASLSRMERSRDSLIQIASNGKVEDHEVAEFVQIQKELERISVSVEALQLWAERMLAEGHINEELYLHYHNIRNSDS